MLSALSASSSSSSSSFRLLQSVRGNQQQPPWNFNKVFGREKELQEIEECIGFLLARNSSNSNRRLVVIDEKATNEDRDNTDDTDEGKATPPTTQSPQQPTLVQEAKKPTTTSTTTKILRQRASTSTSFPPLLVLHGIAGSGKSALISSYDWQSYKSIILAHGKFEKQRSTEPYSAIIDAINDLVDQSRDMVTLELHQLLKDEDDIELLRNIVPKAFQETSEQQQQGLSGDKKHKIKKQGSLLSLEFKGSDSVKASFRKLISILCIDSPVVLFLDDIHSADQSSLDVIKTLSQIDNLMVVLSYRDEEVSVRDNHDHPVTKLLHGIETPIKYIHVDGLDLENVNKVVAEVTGTSSSPVSDESDNTNATMELSKVIYDKTGGNPFFVLEFLQYLRDECYITYNYINFKWEFDNDTIQKLKSCTKISDNVADVVIAKFHRLPTETQITLKIASCLGKEIPLDLLCQYFDFKDTTTTTTTTGDDQQQQDIIWCDSLYQAQRIDLQNVLDYAVTSGILIHKDESSTKYMWSHDKLQTVTYNLIPSKIRPSLHKRLGMLLWGMSKAYPDAEWMVFLAADQLNRLSSSLGRDASRLNLEAATLSLSKSALFPAMEMLRAGVQNLEYCPRCWIDDYDLCLELYSLLGEVAVQIGQQDDAVHAVREVDRNATKLEDKFRSQCVMLVSVTSGQGRDYALGVERAIHILKLYGEKLPNKLLPGQLYLENKKLKSKLPGGQLDGLMDLPDMVDDRSMKITRLLLRQLGMYAVQSPKASHRDVGILATIRALNLACKKGITQDTPMGVLFFAINLRMEGHYKEASEYAKFAISLVDKFPQELGSLHGSVRAIAYCSLLPTTRAFNDIMDGILHAYRIGLRTGDIEKAFSGVMGYSWAYLCIGLPLGPLESDLVSYGREGSQLGVAASVHVLFKILRQTVLNLQQNEQSDDNPTLLKGVAMDQNEELAKLEGNAARMTLRDLNSLRLMLACIYNDWDTAKELVDSLESYLSYDLLIPRGHLRLFYMGLASLILYRKTGKKRYKQIAKKVIKGCKSEIKKGSVNAHPMLIILEAEESPSKESYENAIKICARLGLIHHEAFICERAAKYFADKNRKDRGRDLDAKYYLSQAYTLYKDWGATGKVNAMKKEYGSLLVEEDFVPLSPGVNSSLKGRSRYSARDSLQMSEIIWKSFKTGSKINSLDLKDNGSDTTPLESTDRTSESSSTSTSEAGGRLGWTRRSSVSSITSTSEGGSQSNDT